MAKRSNTDQNRVWTDNVSVEALPKALQAKYAAFKEASRAAAQARDEFNEAFRSHLVASNEYDPDMQNAAVGHNFGRLSFGIADGAEEAAKPRRSSEPYVIGGGQAPAKAARRRR